MIEITREAEAKGSEVSPKVEKRDIQIDDLFRIKFLNSPEISPDGRKIAFTYKWTDLKENTYYSSLYVADVESGVVTPFTRGEKQDSRPRWSPDGKSILFRGDRDKKKGLWILPADGGEAGPLMTDKGALGEYVWSPDGKKVAFTFREAPDPIPLRHISNDPEYKATDEDRPYEILEKVPFKTTGGELLTGLRFHIYLLDVETGKKEQLTQEDFDDGSLAFSPDGRALAFCSNRSEDPIRDYEHNDIYVLDPGTRKVRKVTNHWGPKNAPTWSPDGRFIYFAGHRAPRGKGGPEDVRIYRIPSGGGEPVLITQDFQGYVGNLIVGDTREFDVIVEPFVFPKGGDSLLFSASHEGGCFLYEVPRDGGKPVRIEEGQHEIAACSVDRQGENMAVLRGDFL
ncbi:MAG: PD40 domain-containing protein, partial [Armatimonadetes bacterium]|nr:PD40 domain-containing protein [Armatimonadota bacterium]